MDVDIIESHVAAAIKYMNEKLKHDGFDPSDPKVSDIYVNLNNTMDAIDRYNGIQVVVLKHESGLPMIKTKIKTGPKCSMVKQYVEKEVKE